MRQLPFFDAYDDKKRASHAADGCNGWRYAL